MVFQYSALISSMTVRENLALPLEELEEKSPEEIEAMVKEKLALVGMSGTEDKFPAELSGGMRKRISLARALMMDPELILFDEPSAGLDPVAKSGIDELIIDLTEKKNVTSVIVTHDMDSAFRIATRMAMLYHGKIIQEDVPEKFKHSTNPIVHQFVTGELAGPITANKK
jgi:phospholipid/cholesterol/gamma-HCH transport system ATP-binding protein